MRIRNVPLVVMAQPLLVSYIVPPPSNAPAPKEGGVTTHCADVELLNRVVKNAINAKADLALLMVDRICLCLQLLRKRLPVLSLDKVCRSHITGFCDQL